MRTLVVMCCLIVSASTALACPRGARCATQQAQRIEITSARRATAAPTARTLSLTAVPTQRATPRTPWNLRDLPAKATTEMPWIWEVIRSKVVQKMPTYRDRGRGMSFSLSPVVVVSDSFDSTPGLGISGDF